MTFQSVKNPPTARLSAVILPQGHPTHPMTAAGVERHLVLVRREGWQSPGDWFALERHVRDIDPRIRAFVVHAGQPNSYSRRKAAERPALVFSPGPLGAFRPLRGKVYHGRPIAKIEQLRRLASAGVPVPRTALLTPHLKLDPAAWGEFVVVKPTDLSTSSRGSGIRLVRTRRVRYIAPQNYPPGHPGRCGPMMVQQFIDTGERISLYRVLTLFGEPLYSVLDRGIRPRPPLTAPDEILDRIAIATQTVDTRGELVVEADVLAIARAAHAAIPEVPLKGCDIARDGRTGSLYVLEVNPGGNTWHFSSRYLGRERATNGAAFEQQRIRQFDAFRTAARVLVDRTRAEAE